MQPHSSQCLVLTSDAPAFRQQGMDMNRTRTTTCLAVLAMLLLAVVPAAGQNCSVGSPAFAADNRLWGSLRPGDVDGSLTNPVRLAAERDSTFYDGHGLPGPSMPLYSGVDIENGWIFTSTVSGFQIWDASGVNAEKPQRLSSVDLRTGGCTPNTAFWAAVPECSEVRHFIWDLDAPPNKDDVLAVAGMGPVGLAIVDTSNKTSPRLLYQDSGTGAVAPDGSQVRALTIGGRDYAFFASESGLYRYDMTSARSLNKCLQSSGTCTGVAKGRVGGFSTADGRLSWDNASAPVWGTAAAPLLSFAALSSAREICPVAVNANVPAASKAASVRPCERNIGDSFPKRHPRLQRRNAAARRGCTGR